MNDIASRQAEQLFLVALELKPDKRLAFLDEACAGNPEIRAEVEALLEAAAGSTEYFEKLPERLGVAGVMSGAGDAGEDPSAFAGEPGAQYGQYRLTEPVGRGGMGAVWRAERSDGRYEGEVALKLLAHGTGTAAAERFAREARYLAKLAHPNIARLLDAGVGESGQPYLVLEFVQGVPIDRYCDEHALSIEARVRLFLAVLDAVAHAHAHLIVHRDVKPSNVQVTADGTVKLLDFGVAKLLTEDIAGGLTRELGAALTPEYAAPEQLEGEPVTTATDVYSLGLLLWLLLTGTNPREAAGPRSLAELRALARKEPTRLPDAVTGAPAAERVAEVAERRNASTSELVKTLRSDLDNIVRKALAVSPADRYETVADFAQDLRRWLANEPVTAQAQTIGYRARKFVRRHRGGVLAASLTALALVAAAAITTWQGIEARRQRDIAIYQQHRAEAANEFLTFLFDDVGPQGGPLTLSELLDRGVSLLDRQYGADQPFTAAVLYDLALRYAGLGQKDRTLSLLARSEEIARSAADTQMLPTILCATALHEYAAQADAARAHVAEASAFLTGRSPPSEADVACARARSVILILDRQPQAALDLLTTTLEQYRASPFSSLHIQGILLNQIANVHFMMGDLARTVEVLDEILEIHRTSGREGTVGNVIVSLNRAMALDAQGEILRAYEARLALLDRIEELDEQGQAPIGFWNGYTNSLIALARYDEALGILRRELQRAEGAGDTPGVVHANLGIGTALLFGGRPEEAVPYFDRVEEMASRVSGMTAGMLRSLEIYRVELYLARGDLAEAERRVNELLEVHRSEGNAPGLGNILKVAAKVAITAGDAASALEHANELHAIATRTGDPETSATVGGALFLRAQARQLAGDAGGARGDLELALPPLTHALGEEHPQTIKARELLASLP